MIQKIILNVIIVCVFSVTALFAAEPKIRIQVDPPVIGLDEQATLTFSLDRRAQNITPVGKRDFGLGFIGESYSSQTTINNGVVQSSRSYIYTFILSPKKTGSFEIGSFEVLIDKQKFTASAQDLKIKIVKEAQQKAVNPADPFSQIDAFFNRRNAVPSVGFKLVPRTSSALQNQQIILDGYIVVSDRSAFDFQFSQAAAVRSDKCALFDISETVKSDIRKEGGLYRKLVKRYVIYPIETGKIGIAPPNIIAVTPYGQIQLKSEVIGIDSRKLNDLSGLSYVGDLSVQFRLSTNRVEAGKNCELVLEMTGNGNLKVLSNPYGDLHTDGIYLSSPVTDLKFREYRNNRAIFRQEVKYLLMTKKKGVFHVPPLVIRYYDDRGVPKTAEIRSFAIESIEKDQVVRKENLPLELRPITGTGDFRFLLFSPPVLFLLFLFLLLPGAAALYGRHRAMLAADPDYARKFHAGKKMADYYARAEKKLKENDLKGFYTTVLNGLFHFLTGKLDLPSGVSYREISAAMKDRQLDGEVTGLFEDVYRVCSLNAFSGSTDARSAAETLEKAKRMTELMK